MDSANKTVSKCSPHGSEAPNQKYKACWRKGLQYKLQKPIDLGGSVLVSFISQIVLSPHIRN